VTDSDILGGSFCLVFSFLKVHGLEIFFVMQNTQVNLA